MSTNSSSFILMSDLGNESRFLRRVFDIELKPQKLYLYPVALYANTIAYIAEMRFEGKDSP